MAKKKLSKEDEKQLKLLQATYQMHYNTREETLDRGKTESVERIELIMKDVARQMAKIDPKFADNVVKNTKAQERNKSIIEMLKNEESKNIFDELKAIDGVQEEKSISDGPKSVSGMKDFYDEINKVETDVYALADKIVENEQTSVQLDTNTDNNSNFIYNNIDPNAQYDIIKLPSKGECYKNKLDRIPVGYLTAADENLITSPNLYDSGAITNILLKKKILNKDIDVESLVGGDVDAIMVFLRGTSYGNMFPIIATEPLTKKKIESEVDLQKLNYKPFSLKGDDNGYFDYTLPLSKAEIKFKFLTKKEEAMLQKLNKNENKNIAAYELAEAVQKVRNALRNDTSLSDSDKANIIDANNKIKKWADALNSKESLPYTKTVTNTMEMQIVSVNGNDDRAFIHNFVMNMPASDSLAFRRYIYDNEPGVNFEVEVERPESMGGGSFSCFLEWDDSVWWNISKF